MLKILTSDKALHFLYCYFLASIWWPLGIVFAIFKECMTVRMGKLGPMALVICWLMGRDPIAFFVGGKYNGCDNGNCLLNLKKFKRHLVAQYEI